MTRDRFFHHASAAGMFLFLIMNASTHAQVIEWTRQFGTSAPDNGYAVATALDAIYVPMTARLAVGANLKNCSIGERRYADCSLNGEGLDLYPVGMG